MMNFLTNLFQRREVSIPVTPACQSPIIGAQAEQAVQQQGTSGGDYSYNAVGIDSATKSLGIAAYYRGVELRARTMSQVIIEYRMKSKSGGNFTVDNFGANGKLNYLLHVRPNPLITSAEMLKQIEIKRILSGNAFVYIERDYNGTPLYFWLCQSAAFNPMTNTYSINYYSDKGVVSLVKVPAVNVIHIRNTFTDESGMIGRATHVYARSVLSIAATNDKLVLDNAAKGGKLKLLVQEQKDSTWGVGLANQQELKKAAKRLNDELYSDDVVMMTNVAQVTPISQSLINQDVSVMRNFSVREVSRMIGVPPALLGDAGNSSYKTPEAAMQEFLQWTIQPNIIELENELNAKLLTVDDYDKREIHVCDRNLLRLNPKASAEVDKLRLETGVKTVNELRAANDQPRVKNGDDVYVSTNLAVAGSEKLKGNAGTPSPEKGGKS